MSYGLLPGEVLHYEHVRAALEFLVEDYRMKSRQVASLDQRTDGMQLSRLRRCELISSYLLREIAGREGPVGARVQLESTLEDLASYLGCHGVRNAPSTIQIDARSIMKHARARMRFKDEVPARESSPCSAMAAATDWS